MADAARRREGDAALAAVLRALSNPTRIDLLRQLQEPKMVTRIRLLAEGEEGRPEHAIARQAVKAHLEKLVEAGLVVSLPAEHRFGETYEFVVHHQRLYAVSEDFRELADLRPAVVPAGETSADVTREMREVACPRLLLVRGLREGRAFGLEIPHGGRPREWIVGRRRGLAVSLDYDPFVSLENARIAWAGSGFEIEAFAESRNGATLNFVRLDPGKATPLEHGDLVGVGRSLLLFQERPPRPR